MQVVDREHIDMNRNLHHGISGWHPLVFGSIAEKGREACAVSSLASSLSQAGIRRGDALKTLNGMVVAENRR